MSESRVVEKDQQDMERLESLLRTAMAFIIYVAARPAGVNSIGKSYAEADEFIGVLKQDWR